MATYRIMKDPDWQAAERLRKQQQQESVQPRPRKSRPINYNDDGPVDAAELLTAKMPYGKYAGWFITELPVDYLHWASNNMSSGRINTLCQMALDRRLGLRKK